MRVRFVLVVNPRAGGGRAQRLLPELERALREGNAVFETVLTRGPGDATHQVRAALNEGAEGIAVVGGDGTLNEAINGFFDPGGVPIAPDRWLGPLPVGTGGDFRRTLGISRNVNAMATRMLWSAPRPIDIGWIQFIDHDGRSAERAFINIASFGIGGKVDQLVNRGPKWVGGAPAFLLGTLRAMAVYRNQRVHLTVDDQPTREAEILNVAIANGRYFGGGMHIAPEARIDDQRFDVVSLEGLSTLDQLSLTPDLYRGTILSRRGVHHTRGALVHAEPVDSEQGPVLLDVDGEAPGRLPATFELRPGALQLRA